MYTYIYTVASQLADSSSTHGQTSDIFIENIEHKKKYYFIVSLFLSESFLSRAGRGHLIKKLFLCSAKTDISCFRFFLKYFRFSRNIFDFSRNIFRFFSAKNMETNLFRFNKISKIIRNLFEIYSRFEKNANF